MKREAGEWLGIVHGTIRCSFRRLPGIASPQSGAFRWEFELVIPTATTAMSAWRRVALVLLGYAAAFGVAWMSTSLYVLATDTPDRQTYQGMFAFGDTLVFLGVLAVAALPATAATLFFLRRNHRFWNVLAALSLAIAATAVASAAAYCLRYDEGPHWLQMLALFSPLRVLAAPLFAMLFAFAGLFAPARPSRVLLFGASAAEAAVFLTVALRWFLELRLH